MRRQRLPLTVDCEGCGRTLEVKKYLSSFPAMDVPEDRLTWTVIQQCHLAFELLCLCGHHTVRSCFERSKSRPIDSSMSREAK